MRLVQIVIKILAPSLTPLDFMRNKNLKLGIYLVCIVHTKFIPEFSSVLSLLPYAEEDKVKWVLNLFCCNFKMLLYQKIYHKWQWNVNSKEHLGGKQTFSIMRSLEKTGAQIQSRVKEGKTRVKGLRTEGGVRNPGTQDESSVSLITSFLWWAYFVCYLLPLLLFSHLQFFFRKLSL